jgi:hypothetical protein
MGVASPAAFQPQVLSFGTDIVSEIYKQSIPGFASMALDRLHGSLYASSRYLQLSDPEQTTPNTWIGYRSGEVIGVLLFRIEGKRVIVLCEVISLDSLQVNAFAASVFSNFSGICHIAFNAVSLSMPPTSLPTQFYPFSENYVLTLPASTEGYMAMLGKSTRQSLRGYRNRLLRDFPDFRWSAYTCDELSEEQQRQLVSILQDFKRESMSARGKSAAIDATETQHLLTMAAESGLFGVARVNGRICAGAFSCRIGDSYVMLLSASDPAMSVYRLGLLTCLWSVNDCIHRGGRQCHMLWGRYQYKHQLLAVPKSLYRLVVYPSVAQMLMQPITVLRMFFCGRYIRCMQWLHSHIKRERNPGWQWLYRQYQLLKKIPGMIRNKFQWLRKRNSDLAVEIAATTGVNNKKDIDAATNLINAPCTNVIGTASQSRCPMQAL